MCSPVYASRLEINLVQSGVKKKTPLQDFGMYGTYMSFSLNECFPQKTKLHFPLKSAKSLRNGTPVCSPGHVSRLEINLVQSGAKKKTLLQDVGMYGTYMSFSLNKNVSFPQKTKLHFPLKSAKSLRNGTPVCSPGHVSRLEINLVQSGAKKKTLLQDVGMYGTYMSFSLNKNVSFPQKRNFTFP